MRFKKAIALFKYLPFFLKTFFEQLRINLKAKKLGYYTSIDDIPIYNWNQIEQGKFEFLFKDKQGKVPIFFTQIISDMFFQFEHINLDLIRKKHKAAYLLSLFVTKKDVKYLNQYRHLEAEIKKDESKKVKRQTLNQKVNYIEETFNQIASIDVKKISTSRFYSLYYQAIERNRKLRQDANNKKKRFHRG